MPDQDSMVTKAKKVRKQELIKKLEEQKSIEPFFYIVATVVLGIISTTILYLIFAFGNYSFNVSNWSEGSRYAMSTLIFAFFIFWTFMTIEMHNSAVAMRSLELKLVLMQSVGPSKPEKI